MSEAAPRATWGEKVRENARAYYDKFGLQCCTPDEFTLWFRKAEGARTRCRLLCHFCADCLPEYEQAMRARGLCVKPTLGGEVTPGAPAEYLGDGGLRDAVTSS